MSESKAINNVKNDDDNSLYVIDDFESYYLDSFISSNNKSVSYQKACKATGYTIPKYLSQAAYKYHKTLDKDGKIEKALLNATLGDRIASRLKLNDLRDNAESEQVQLAAAKHTVGTLYSSESQQQGIEVNVNRDNVSIKAGKDTLTIQNDLK